MLGSNPPGACAAPATDLIGFVSPFVSCGWRDMGFNPRFLVAQMGGSLILRGLLTGAGDVTSPSALLLIPAIWLLGVIFDSDGWELKASRPGSFLISGAGCRGYGLRAGGALDGIILGGT